MAHQEPLAYRGTATSAENKVSPERSTSFFLTGIPIETDYQDFFLGFRNIGSIRHCHMNEPYDRHPETCAAKVVFFTRLAAEIAFESIQAGSIKINGVQPNVTWNRYRTPEEAPEGRSRVIRIEGPSDIVHTSVLKILWSVTFWWNTDTKYEIDELDEGVSVIWYYFASYYFQAENATKVLHETFGDIVDVSYQEDPCA
ncbi:Uu.00g082980.m01.CDS01 [Anthostomella pinea]|uniref:Uu.00g082980.m01.CDS01 n=1 Tax=Anthostomella pinea TaxID=933095 RepID=A0AAI8YJL1_9PEZI|nr:Uu.00g082980.m01.CDS01 [Anthostomella pinea]